MFFYCFEIGGFDYVDQKVMQHTNEFTEEEFSSLIDRVALRFVPEAIAEKFANKKHWVEKLLNENEKNKSLIPAIMEEANLPGELRFEDIASKVVDVLIEEFGFSYLKYTATVEKDGADVIGIIPPVL